MLATISPANIHVDETLATLRYACQARRIVNRIRVNESEKDKIIRELRKEIDRLKSLHYEYERKRCNQSIEIVKEQHQESFSNNNVNTKVLNEVGIQCAVEDANIYKREIETLREQLAERMRELKCAEKSWLDRLHEAEQSRNMEMQILERNGLALEWKNSEKQACLANLSDDPILSGTLFYMLPFGRVRIGRKVFAPEDTKKSKVTCTPDIILDGPLIGRLHW